MYEKDRLIKAGRPELAEKVKHVSRDEGDGAGYDIQSYNEDGSIIYIEVKSTRGNIGTPFEISANEVEFSRENADKFYLYRIFNLSKQPFLIIIPGAIEETFEMKPTSFRCAGFKPCP